MAQKKKTTKKQLKQRQRQYQKQSVVVNVNTATKRRRATGKKSAKGSGESSVSFAPQLIQTVPLQYSPQTMLDQSSILSQDSRNRIFQSEIRNGISFMNEEREKNAVNNNKREAWLTEQENIINKTSLRSVVEQPDNAEEIQYTKIKNDMNKAQKTINERAGRVDELKNQYMDAERAVLNPFPTPRDNSILNLTQPTDGGSSSVIEPPVTPKTIRVIKKRNPPPTLPTAVDNAINMNAPAAAMEEPSDEVEDIIPDERVGKGKRPRNYGYPEFTLLPNGKWRCNTCDPFKDVEKGSRGKHLDTKIHERNLLNPRPPFRV